MSDLFKGQSMSEAYRFISAGTAHTFDFNFQPDKVVFTNLTDWAPTAGNLPISIWFREQTDAAEAYQHQVIDSAAASSFNFANPTTNGFTVADTSGGQAAQRSSISGVTAADPVVVTTSAVHGYQSGQIVRITDLGSDMPTARGMEQINNLRFKITVLSTTTFSLQDPVTGEDIDGSAYTAWVSGGSVIVESRVITLNNPEAVAYTANPFSYDPIDYKLTAGTNVMGADSDVFLIEAFKWGRFEDLGDLLT